jgi:hypothetical protein
MVVVQSSKIVADGAVQSQCRHAAIEIGVLSAPTHPVHVSLANVAITRQNYPILCSALRAQIFDRDTGKLIN